MEPLRRRFKQEAGKSEKTFTRFWYFTENSTELICKNKIVFIVETIYKKVSQN